MVGARIALPTLHHRRYLVAVSQLVIRRREHVRAQLCGSTPLQSSVL